MSISLHWKCQIWCDYAAEDTLTPSNAVHGRGNCQSSVSCVSRRHIVPLNRDSRLCWLPIYSDERSSEGRDCKIVLDHSSICCSHTHSKASHATLLPFPVLSIAGFFITLNNASQSVQSRVECSTSKALHRFYDECSHRKLRKWGAGQLRNVSIEELRKRRDGHFIK